MTITGIQTDDVVEDGRPKPKRGRAAFQEGGMEKWLPLILILAALLWGAFAPEAEYHEAKYSVTDWAAGLK